jgi:hypothetical protein
MALPSTRQFLPLPVLGLPPRQALPASPATVRSDHEVITAVGMLLRVRAVSFQPLVMRFRWSQRCLHATIPPTVVDLTPLALPVAVLVVIGVLRCERVLMDALLSDGVPRRVASSCKNIDLRSDRPQVRGIHTATVQTRRPTWAGLAAVVALMVHLAMVRFTAPFRQRLYQHLVRPPVHWLWILAGHRVLTISGTRMDPSGPMPAPILVSLDLRPEPGWQSRVPEYHAHVSNLITPPQARCD